MIEFGNEEHGRAIMGATGAKFSSEVMTVISRQEDGELRGGVVYENWTGRGGSIVVHFAGFYANWISRDLLWVGFHYPFSQLDCKQIFAQMRADNDNSIKVATGMGFEQAVRLEAVYPDTDMILFRLWRTDCRFLSHKPRSIKFGRMF